jgi:hypothetical protein
MFVHVIVALFSGVSAFINHHFIPFATPRASLRCIGFCSSPCCWCCCFFLAIGWLHVPCTSSSLLLHDLLLVLSRHDHLVLLTNICSSLLSLFSPQCITLFPFTLRRASHSKPPNIYYSLSSSSLHCKISHRSYTTHASFSLTRSRTPIPQHTCQCSIESRRMNVSPLFLVPFF